jgi:hypothetical protein
MNLQLFVNEKLIASLPINEAYISYPVYLASLKSELQTKYKHVIESSMAKPRFHIEKRTSSNRRKVEHSLQLL